jgi:AcrR family transcriptional regulator
MFRHAPAHHAMCGCVAVTQLTFQRARTEQKRQRAAAIVEAARSPALETGVASVTLTGVANRAGVHYSAVRRYFTSHKEVLLHLAAEGWVRWSVEHGLRGVARARSDVAIAGLRDVSQRSGRRPALLRPARQPSPAPRA